MEEKDLTICKDKSKQVIHAAVTVLTILGLLTAVAVVAMNLYKKLKESVRKLNEDGVIEPIEDKELAGEEGSEDKNEGVFVDLDESESEEAQEEA